PSWRRPAERRLHEIRRRAEWNEPLDPSQAVIARTWRVTTLRNHYAHHGLDQRVDHSAEDEIRRQLDEIVATWHETWRSVPELSLDLPPLPGSRVLVSPVGTRPGVLYSALRAVDPRQVMRCLVICSDNTKSLAEEA